MFLSNENLADKILLLLRIVVGVTFILHGTQKVFGWFGGTGLKGFAQWLFSLGIPTWLSYVGALAELAGGILVLLGVAAEIGALMLLVEMIFAIYLVHWSHGYFIQNNGFEYPLNLLFLCLMIILGGAGRYSLLRL